MVDDLAGTASRWLREVPFFAGLPEADLNEIASAGWTTAVPEGEIVFHEGDVADRLYVILDGQVRIFKTNEDGTETTLAWPGVGGVFGEMALLDGGRRSAGIATVADCRFFTLDRADFLATISSRPELLTRVMTELTSKIRESGERSLREEMEAERLRVETELQRHRALSQVVAGVAHELNTPLGIARTAASVLTEILAGEGASAGGEDGAGADARTDVAGAALPVRDMLEAADLLDRNILRAHKLVQDFKAVSVGQVVDERDSHDLLEVVREVVSLFEIEAKRANIEIELRDRLGDAERTWVGYRGYLTQVILNCLTNAQRYAYPDGEGGEVEITVSATGDEADPGFAVSVRDFGVGIPEDALAKVFEPFYTTGRGKGGTGLGLAIVRNLVTSGLDGSIRIESAPGEGTEVHVTLPRTVPERKATHAGEG